MMEKEEVGVWILSTEGGDDMRNYLKLGELLFHDSSGVKVEEWLRLTLS